MGFFTSLMRTVERRTTPENPSFDLNSPDAFDALGATKTDSGIQLSAEMALTYGPWFRGLSLISGDVAQLPLRPMDLLGDGRQPAKKHPLYRTLRRTPNPYQSAIVFKRQLTGHALSRGNGFAYIERVGKRSPNLWPLDPDKTRIEKATNGEIRYVSSDGQGNTIQFKPMEILHIKGMSFDGLTGYNVWQVAKNTLGAAIGAMKQRAGSQKNGARPQVVIETEQQMDEAQANLFRQSWDKIQCGPENIHRTAILTQGMKAHALTFSNEDGQFSELLDRDIRFVATILGIPSHKLGDASRAGYNGLESENQAYVDDALSIWLNTWQDECWHKLLTEQEQAEESVDIEFDWQELIRADMAAKANYNQKALGNRGWMTQNEARGRDGLPPLDGEQYDLIPEPVAPAPPNADGNSDTNAPNPPPKPEPQPTPKPKKRAIDAAQQLLRDAGHRAIKMLASHVQRAAKSPDDFMDLVDGLEKEHLQRVSGILTPSLANADALFERETGHESVTQELFDELRGTLFELAGQVSAKELPAAVERWSVDFETVWTDKLEKLAGE